MEAPDSYNEVVRQMRQHTEINLLDEVDRGRLVDAVAISLNGGHARGPWGRKARQRDGGNKNTDALAYARLDGRFELFDIINGGDPNPGDPDRGKFASWSEFGPFAPGENGWWAPAEGGATTAPVGTSPNGGGELADLRAQIDVLKQNVVKYGDRVAFRDSQGKVVCADRNLDSHLIANRDNVGSWETLTVERP